MVPVGELRRRKRYYPGLHLLTDTRALTGAGRDDCSRFVFAQSADNVRCLLSLASAGTRQLHRGSPSPGQWMTMAFAEVVVAAYGRAHSSSSRPFSFS